MTIDEDLHTIMSTVDDTREHISEGQYLRTCEAICRIHVKLKSPKLPLPSFNNRHTVKCLYMFSYAVSVIKIVEKVVKIVSKR
tara:strand:+ start:416 stop:664 length:249 start_codon:yes stop_codon:yes gene_type:complete